MKFVYYWENKITGQWYIGSRTAAGCHINDGYICSSKIAKPLIMAKPDEWARTILFEHEDPKVVIAKETELLMEFDAAHDALALNRHNGGLNFSTAGNTLTADHRSKISACQIGRKHTDETREKMSVSKTGRKHTDETKKKMRAAATGKISPHAVKNWWYHPIHDTFYGTARELAEKYELNRHPLDQVRNGRKQHCQGWVTDESILNKLICNPTTNKWLIK